MPKVPSSKAALMRKWLTAFDTKHFAVVGEKILCRPCGTTYQFERKSQLNQHIGTSGHQRATTVSGSSLQQTMQEVLPSSEDKKPSEFASDLVAALLQEGMPLQKLEDGRPFRKFIDKYWSIKVPCLKTLRCKVVPAEYIKVLTAIRSEIGQAHIWCSVDETTDRLGRNVVNVIAGKLDGKTPAKGRLLHVKIVEKTNASTIAMCVQEGLRILWEGAPDTSERLLLFVTDSASYMLKAAVHLKAFYPKMLHLTCLSHGLHRVAETVRDKYTEVNKLISATKKVFLKAPTRVELFKNILPGVPLPPEPIITRWGTWITAATYYAENLEGIRKVFDSLEANEAKAIGKVKEALDSPELETQLTYIQRNFDGLPKLIESLQRQDLPLVDAVRMVDSLSKESFSGSVGESAQMKLGAVLKRNPAWEAIQSIAARLSGEVRGNLPEGWDVADAFFMKFAPASSADVERSFSKFKILLNERRTNLTEENVKQHMVVYFNNL